MSALTEKEMQVCKLREKARSLRLDAPESFFLAPDKVLAEIYNGAGPEWMCKVMRHILTFALREFEPAILIHDYRFELSDKTVDGFNRANRELFNNCVRLTLAEYSWYDPLRYKWLFRAFVTWRACVSGGWSAWIGV